MSSLLFTAQVVAPVFIIVLIGVLLQHRGVINESFNSTASHIVFRVTLPALVFQNIAASSFDRVFSGKLILFIVICATIMFSLATLISIPLTRNGRDQGAFIQGSSRSNYAIIGSALIHNAFGDSGLAIAAIVLALIMPFYNIYSILALSLPMHKEKSLTFSKTMLDIVTNPLIIAAVLALPFSIFTIPLHPIIIRAIGYLANLTLPLALLAIGGRLTFHSLRKDFRLAVAAAFNKLFFMPIVFTTAAVLLGFRGAQLGAAFFLFAAPTAVASFPMAEAMGSNGRLAGNIVLVTTLVSVLTISIGVYVLKSLNYF